MVAAVALPVLWICGPPGVGKSTVGWEVRQRIAAGGADLAYVDVDQLGICYPEPESDPSRTRLQARVLARMIDGFAAEGASGVVVSGVTDPESGPHGDLLPNADLTVVRLDADAATLRTRLTGRGSDDLVDGALRDATTLAASTFADRVVTTTGVDVGGVVDQIVADVAGAAAWQGSGTVSGVRSPATVAAAPDLPPGASTGRILLLAGPTGVGKSTIGFPVFLQSLGSGGVACPRRGCARLPPVRSVMRCSMRLSPASSWIRQAAPRGTWRRNSPACGPEPGVVGPDHCASRGLTWLRSARGHRATCRSAGGVAPQGRRGRVGAAGSARQGWRGRVGAAGSARQGRLSGVGR